jgi:ankyrin repeat protein
MESIKYISALKYKWRALKQYDKLTVDQIKLLDNDCERMYLYFYCDHPNFYNYKKKKLLNRYINDECDNLLLFAAALGKIDALKYLVLSGLNINYKNKYDLNACLIAAQFGQVEMLKYLVSYGLNINCENKHDLNGCLIVAQHGHVEMLKYLVSCGFDINYKSENNMNVYLCAAQHGQIEMLKYLDTTTIDKNTKDTNGNNAYLCAAYGGHISVLKYFENKFDIHYKNLAGENAYFMASGSNDNNVMIYLESLNINIYEKANTGHTVYDLWSRCGSVRGKNITSFLLNKSKYTGYSKICSICYEIKDDKFITCKNNHIVHLECQRQKDRNRCLMCSAKYLI